MLGTWILLVVSAKDRADYRIEWLRRPDDRTAKPPAHFYRKCDEL
ncbi:MAG: hypothetical protein QOH31_986 [Verrucomicrobiota bacterium]|jgi:hypothetical protein